MLELLSTGRKFGYVSPFNVADVLLGLGRERDAVAALERGVREGDAWSIFLPHHQMLSRVNGMERVIAKIVPARHLAAR